MPLTHSRRPTGSGPDDREAWGSVRSVFGDNTGPTARHAAASLTADAELAAHELRDIFPLGR